MRLVRHLWLLCNEGNEQPLSFTIDGPDQTALSPPPYHRWRSMCRITIEATDIRSQEVFGIDDLHAVGQALACVAAAIDVMSAEGTLAFTDGTCFDEKLHSAMLPLLLAATLLELHQPAAQRPRSLPAYQARAATTSGAQETPDRSPPALAGRASRQSPDGQHKPLDLLP